jgi:hypothetical protein
MYATVVAVPFLRWRVAVAVGAAVGVGALLAAVAIPTILTAVGFSSIGVEAGSMAACWQSTYPLVTSGSPFSLLQSISMGGSRMVMAGITVAGGFIGGAMAAFGWW